MKTCSKCKETKPFEEFYKRKDRASGYKSECKPCTLGGHKYNPVTARRAYKKKYAKDKAGYVRRCAERRARMRNANVQLSEEARFYMNEMYHLAQLRSELTGVPHEVDHIIPLAGPDACGLHGPWNLQILTANENRRKGNRHG